MASSEKIIFVPFILAFGGVERLVLALSRYLYARGSAHKVVCFDQTINLAGYANWPMQVYEIKPRRNPLAEGWALSRFLQAAYANGSPPALLFDLKGAFYAGLFPPSGYYLHLTDPPSLLPTETSKYAPSLRGSLPWFEDGGMAGIVKKPYAEVVHRINRRGARGAASVVVMTDSIAGELQDIYGVKAHVVRPGINKPKNRRHMGVRSGNSMHILSVCRLELSKRIDWIINALAALESSSAPLSGRVDWTLEIVGEGSEKENLHNLAEKAGISGRTVFHGRVSDARIEELYVESDMFIMPAVQGYGLPALEALAKGVPVILHRESGVSEILGGTPWAIIIDKREDLSTAIDKMVGRLLAGEHAWHPLPTVPAEEEWAKRICEVCQWI